MFGENLSPLASDAGGEGEGGKGRIKTRENTVERFFSESEISESKASHIEIPESRVK